MRGMATAKPVMRKLPRIQDESIQGLIAHQETHGLSIPSGKISPLRVEMTIAAEADDSSEIPLSVISNPSAALRVNSVRDLVPPDPYSTGASKLTPDEPFVMRMTDSFQVLASRRAP
jgi:hypothetical protein